MSTTDQGDAEAPAEQPDSALGLVAASGRGDLPSLLLHGESLATHALRALSSAGVEALPPEQSWASVQHMGLPVVLHDALCPMTPAPFLAKAIAAASGESPVVAVGCRPVTDTIKRVSSGIVGETVDRQRLLVVTSPVVLSAGAVAALRAWPEQDDFAQLVRDLGRRFPVSFLEAPSLGRRVEDESAVMVLEAFAELHPA